MRLRLLRCGSAALLLVSIAGCATDRAVKNGNSAARRGDWDAAVAFYRQALGKDPDRIDVKITLQRAMGEAAAIHITRARQLEAQDQLPGAIAEYRLAAELDPSNTLSSVKVNELERKMRERIEASRPPSQLDRLREQVRQSSTIPTLDPRIKLGALKFTNASIRDILTNIGNFSNPPLSVTYAQTAEPLVTRPYSIDVTEMSLEEAFNQVLSNNQLSFKLINQRTVLVFQDTPGEHQKYDDLYSQVFYLSNVEPADMIQIINQMTTTASAASRPTCTPNKSTTTITCRATGPLMGLIDRLIKANDKPKAEVLLEIQILEVDRIRMKQLGLDLTQYALGFTFSPEVAPPNTAGVFPPVSPPPFNLNTITGGIGPNDYYVTVPTALVRAMESDNKTRTLAKPSVRGAEGVDITMNLGDQIPVLNSTIPSVTTGLGTTAPVTNFTYRPIGVNLSVKAQVTFDDEIILDLTVDNSGVGAEMNVGGTIVQSFTGRTVHTKLRLRDGESNLLAGLLRENTTSTNTGVAGLVRIPFVRNLFGNTQSKTDQSDVVIIVTPHIVRSHELTPEDLRPLYIGTQQNLGQTGAAPPAPGAAAPTGAPPAAPPATPPRAPGVVPVVPVGGDTPAPATPPAAPPQTPVIALFSPGTEFQSGAATPYTVPITVSNMPEVNTITLRVSFNAQVLRAQNAVQGTFMAQGNASPTFVPRIDANAGTVDLVFSRPAGSRGASGTDLLGSIQFLAMSPGSSQITISGSAVGPNGQAIPVQFGPATVVVK